MRIRNALVMLTLVCSVCFAEAQAPPRVVHVFVALADNAHQGIVPVPAHLGNGDDPARNLYWGSAYGVKAFFAHSSEWKLLSCVPNPKTAVLERCIFRHKAANAYLVADAYQGSKIAQATIDFLMALAGGNVEDVAVMSGAASLSLNAGGKSQLLAYVGHDGLMDFDLTSLPRKQNDQRREAIILACASKQYFSPAVRASGATPLLWTTNLMAPEAYTLKSALDGWIANEDSQQIRQRAAEAYHQYQKCSTAAAMKLLVTGW